MFVGHSAIFRVDVVLNNIVVRADAEDDAEVTLLLTCMEWGILTGSGRGRQACRVVLDAARLSRGSSGLSDGTWLGRPVREAGTASVSSLVACASVSDNAEASPEGGKSESYLKAFQVRDSGCRE